MEPSESRQGYLYNVTGLPTLDESHNGKSKMHSHNVRVIHIILQSSYLGAIPVTNISGFYVGARTQTDSHQILLRCSWVAPFMQPAPPEVSLKKKQKLEKIEVLQATDWKQWID